MNNQSLEIHHSNKLIEHGNFDPKIHSSLRWCDAFGNKIIAPEGYYLLRNDAEVHDIVKMGDIHFDIYGGWTSGGESYHARHGHYVQSEGRWKAWARKINQFPEIKEKLK